MRHILRDPRSLLMALALPALMLLLFGWALTLDVDELPAVALDRDQTPASRELISLFEGSRYFRLLGHARNYARIQRLMDEGACMAAIVINEGFEREILRGGEARVQILLDGSDSNTASIGLGYAEAIVNEFSLQARRQAAARLAGRVPELPLEARQRIWYNAELESKNYVVPGLVAVILMLIASLLTSLTLARERESGTMEQLLATPARPAEIVLGKMSAYFLLGIADALIAIVLGVAAFQVPLRGSVLLLAFSCLLFLFGALCWGILISAASSSQLMAFQAGIISSFLPAFLLSGFVFPIDNMPSAIQAITYLIPARYFVTLLKGIFLKASGIEVLAWEIALLAAFGAVVFFAAARSLERKVA